MAAMALLFTVTATAQDDSLGTQTSMSAKNVESELPDTVVVSDNRKSYRGPNEEDLPKSVKKTQTVRMVNAADEPEFYDEADNEVSQDENMTTGISDSVEDTTVVVIEPMTEVETVNQQPVTVSGNDITETVAPAESTKRERVAPSVPHSFRSLEGEELPHSVKRTSTVRTVMPGNVNVEETTKTETEELTVTDDNRGTVRSQMAPPEKSSGKVTRTQTVRTITPAPVTNNAEDEE